MRIFLREVDCVELQKDWFSFHRPIKRCLSVYFARRRSTKERKTITENPPQYGSIETGEPERAPLKGPNKPILYNCRLNYTLLDGGSRPLFDEYLEMCTLHSHNSGLFVLKIFVFLI